MAEYIFGGGKSEPISKTKKSKNLNKNKDKDKDKVKDAIKKQIMRDFKEQPTIKEITKKPVIQEQQLSISEEIKREYRFPLDFVEYLEKKHIPKKCIPELDNIFQVGSCQSNGPKYDVLTFQKKETLNKQFFCEINDTITAITGQGEYLYVGMAQGIVKKYSCKEEKELYSFDSAITNHQICKVIMCIDVSNDSNFLVVGYANGYVSLWDMRNNKNKLLKLVDKVQTTTILSIKFLSTNVYKQEIISADKEGNVLLFTFTQKLLLTSVIHSYLLKDPTPVFVMDIYTPTSEQKTLYPFCDTDAVFGAFGSINKVLVILLKPNIKKLFKIENPAYNNAREIPDVSFGIGNEPMKHRNQYIMKSLDKQNLCVMVAISWNTVLAVYKINIDDFSINNQAIGYYKNDNYQILRMGFLDTSEIFFLDSLKKIKILHTSFMSPQLFLDDKKSRRSNDVTSLIDEGKTIDADTTCQKLIFDPLDIKSTQGKETYNNFLFAKDKIIFFLCKHSFYYGILLTWEESIKALKDKNLWEDAIFLAVNIHEGLITTLPNIPIDENQRKQELRKIITKEMFPQYIKYVMYKIRGEKNWEENIKKCINMCIEICIQINSIDFLFKEIQPKFYQYEKTFIHLLEPFILLSRLYKFDLDKEAIDKIIDYYTETSQNILLIQILLNLKAESIDIESVHKYMEKNHLYTLLIYLNSKRYQYFNSIDKMYDKLQRFKEIKDSDFISYSNCLKTMQINDVLTSKPYMTHKVLWYCNYCLAQKIFPDDSPIEQRDFEKLVIQILDKFLIEEVFFEFLNYDSYSFLQIMSRFIIDEKLSAIIEVKHKMEKGAFGDLVQIVARAGIDVSSLSIINILMEYVIITSNKLESILIKQDLNLFIAVCSINELRLNKGRAIEAGENLLLFYKNIKSLSELDQPFDKFNAHGLRAENVFYIKELTDILSIIIEYVSEDNNKLTHFLSLSESTPLIIIRIKILLKLFDYIEALEVIMQYKKELGRKKVIEWINAILNQTKANEKMHKKFKETLIQKTADLTEFSIDDTFKIIDEWFHNQELKVILQLDSNKKIQYEFIEKVLKNKSEEEIIREGDHKIKEYTEILLLHIRLLIQLNKKDEVLKNLMKRNSYPLEDVLSLCIEHKVNDAAIHIYLSVGDNKKAISIGLGDLSIAVIALKDYGFKKKDYDDKDDKWNKLLENALIEKKKCIAICKQTSLTTSNSENEELWFLIFNELYTLLSHINKEIQDKLHIINGNHYLYELNKYLSDDLNSLLKEMCNYIPIKQIIENVTSNYQDAEFKQFKMFLSNMFSTFSHLTNMFYSTKHLLSNTIKYNIINYKRENAKGISYDMNICDFCHSEFNTEENVIVFKCKHKVHNCSFCVIIEMNMPVCKICKKNDIEDIGSKANNYSTHQKKTIVNVISKEINALKKLKAIDDYLLEQAGIRKKKTNLY